MASGATASIIPIHQAPEKRAKTPAERARDCRARKKARLYEPLAESRSELPATSLAPVTEPVKLPITSAVTEIVALHPVTHHDVTPSHRPASILLIVAAMVLASVGVTMNGWFARSLGSSDVAGWLFLAVGVGADLVALAIPSCAAQLWQACQRVTALAGWVIWSMTFAFAVTAGIGFASVNITDVTLARASRATPAVTAAQAALADSMSARNRECSGGVGKVCRQREEAVAELRRTLDAAMHDVEQTADPQTEAVSRIVAWVSFGALKPTGDDFAMLRLVLLALLPQVGGILLMVGRTK